MASQDVESGFEALLKPLQDINSKMWDIMLTAALEKYLAQINNGDTTVVNFTEAAVLVQNSASFYCKRVDSVYLGCRQFVEKLINTDKEEGEEDGQAVKKKRKPKNLVTDNFEPVDLFYPEGNIDVNLDTIDKYADQKEVILNKYIKAAKKQNTSCPVYQTKGSEMGLKEEFRLHWGISSNGILNEDFVTTRIPRTLDWQFLSDDVVYDDTDPEVLRNSFAQLENSFEMNVDKVAPPGSPGLVPSPLPPDSPMSQPPPLPTDNIPMEKPSNKELVFKELVFNFVPPPKDFFKKQAFTVPKTLINEVDCWRAKKLENKEQTDNSNYTFNSFFDFLRHQILLHKSSSFEEKLYMSSKKRRKHENQMRQKYFAKAAAAVADDCNDDFHGFDNNGDDENNLDDLQLDDVADLIRVNIPDIERDTDTQDREKMMAAFQENRRRCAAELTEVARRVQAWHESLASVLEAAEARSQYDIHQYGTRILDSFDEPPEKKPVISFENMVQNQQGISKPEISRYLLSSLMLANTYNVKIIVDKDELAKDCLQLQLLSTVRHHEEMDENLKSNTHC